jgi:hypothetical protein
MMYVRGSFEREGTMIRIVLRRTGFIVLVALLAVGCSPVGTLAPMATAAPSERPPGLIEEKGAGFPAGLHVIVNGCDTSVDVAHGMGEVTNTYVYMSNQGTVELKNVTLTVNGSDEQRQHPDKSVTFDSLPAGYEVTSKLTIDTVFRKQTVVEVVVKIGGEQVYRLSQNCQAIAQEARDRINAILGRVRKIQ